MSLSVFGLVFVSVFVFDLNPASCLPRAANMVERASSADMAREGVGRDGGHGPT